MADKTVGLKLEDWRKLKQIALDRDCTLSQAVAYLIEVAKEQGERDEAASTGNTGSGTDKGNE